MVKQISIVIGANYGDEGKGLVVQDLVRKSFKTYKKVPLVVRANGGCQAGHTVRFDEPETTVSSRTGKKHLWDSTEGRWVFKTHGSGTMLGAHTYLAPRFIFNPIIFADENRKLVEYGIHPITFVSPKCRLTLPVDMIINQWLEQKRGDDRHGSCGMGVGETAARNELIQFGLGEFLNLSEKDKEFILTEYSLRWAARRVQALGYDYEQDFEQQWIDLILNEGIRNNYISDLMSNRAFTLWHDVIDLTKAYNHWIFEGAQGLGLDEDSANFPYVTYSKTGSVEPDRVIQDANLVGENTIIDRYYVSRCYNTRHGAGPLEDEDIHHNCTVVDETNQPNMWQGELRTCALEIDEMTHRIEDDVELPIELNQERITDHIVLTHCNLSSNLTYTTYDEQHDDQNPQSLSAHISKIMTQKTGMDFKENFSWDEFHVLTAEQCAALT